MSDSKILVTHIWHIPSQISCEESGGFYSPVFILLSYKLERIYYTWRKSDWLFTIKIIFEKDCSIFPTSQFQAPVYSKWIRMDELLSRNWPACMFRRVEAWHNIHTQFRENRSNGSKVERDTHTHTHIHSMLISSHKCILFFRKKGNHVT
jgi:hypothetical protein